MALCEGTKFVKPHHQIFLTIGMLLVGTGSHIPQWPYYQTLIEHLQSIHDTPMCPGTVVENTSLPLQFYQ